MNKFSLYLFFIILLTSCSLEKSDIVEQNKKNKEIFVKIKPIEKELNSGLKINIKKLTKGKPFLQNNSNNNGNTNFQADREKKSLYKFSVINKFEFNQPELLFTEKKNIIFFDGKGSIFKINEDLKKVWKVNYYSKKEKKLEPILYFAQNGQSLLVCDTLSKIYSVNLSSGKLNWMKNSQSSFNSNIKIYKNTFITVDFDNVIKSFNIKDGKELWNFKTENSFIKSQKKLSVILKGEIVYFVNNLGDLTALNVNNGSLIWQTPTQSNVIYQNAFSLKISDLVFANNSIYFSNNKNEIFSFDANSGFV